MEVLAGIGNFKQEIIVHTMESLKINIGADTLNSKSLKSKSLQ